MTQQTFNLTQSDIDKIAEAVSKSSEQEKRNAIVSHEAFLRWLTNWGLHFIANKIANWALSQIKSLWHRLTGR
ncbi:MAG: hypothetical protein MGF17_16325 [Trichodesmium sp. MAG_R04]|jgi:hypothetical protein|nr:hypothetical protein [Trichodesmium sp. MAG_R04]